MELYYRNAVMSYDYGLVCSIDGSSEVYKMVPEDTKERPDEPSFISIANFEAIDTVEEDA